MGIVLSILPLFIVLSVVVLSIFGAIYAYKGLKFYFALQNFTKQTGTSEGRTEEDQGLIDEVSSTTTTLLVLSVITLAFNSNLVVGAVLGLVAYLNVKDKAIEDLRKYLDERREKISGYKRILFIILGLVVMTLVILFFLVFFLTLATGLNDM